MKQDHNFLVHVSLTVAAGQLIAAINVRLDEKQRI